MAREGTIAFGIVEERDEVPLGMRSLIDSIQPGIRTETYNRVWVMTRYRRGGAKIYGRIGIVTAVEQWDEDLQDFHEEQLEAGYATPYMLDLEQQRIVFQTRGSTIKPQSFANAFEHLLNEAVEAEAWRVTLAERGMDWETFRDYVDRIEQLTFKLDAPNPRFPNRLGEQLVGEADAASTTVTLRGDALNDDAAAVQQMMVHARTYGHVRAIGAAGGGKVSYRSKGDKAQITATVPSNPETGDVEPDVMAEHLDRWNEVDYFTGERSAARGRR